MLFIIIFIWGWLMMVAVKMVNVHQTTMFMLAFSSCEMVSQKSVSFLHSCSGTWGSLGLSGSRDFQTGMVWAWVCWFGCECVHVGMGVFMWVCSCVGGGGGGMVEERKELMSLGSKHLPHYEIFCYHLQLRFHFQIVYCCIMTSTVAMVSPWYKWQCINNQLTTELNSLEVTVSSCVP